MLAPVLKQSFCSNRWLERRPESKVGHITAHSAQDT